MLLDIMQILWIFLLTFGLISANDYPMEDEESSVTSHIYEINENFHNPNLIYGDILRGPEDQKDRLEEAYDWQHSRMNAIIKEKGANRWPKNEVPYEISSIYSATERNSIESGISALQSATCFKFSKKSSQKDYLYIDKKNGCYSSVGRKGGKQLVSLGKGCLSMGTVQHELMHALGIEHEHQRPDRDKYIRVKFENVEPGKKDNFDKISYNQVDLHGLPYDFKSVMHYDGKAFGKKDSSTNKQLDTMVPLQSGVSLLDNTKLSDQDLKKLQILGNCGGAGKSGGKAGSKSGGKSKNKGKKKKQKAKGKRKRMERIFYV